MELAKTGSEVTHDLKSTSAFGIQMNAKMYSILTDKLYTDKPGAVIRELSANALDAHKEAGCYDTPFEIKVPTMLDPSFHIRDFGTGIDPDKFESIYTNVGESTKDKSDEYIGAYGLGSKTPFALVESYTVENYYQGTCTVYQCFKENGMPQVSMVGSGPTQEGNGLKISFPLNASFERALKESISVQLANFPTRPNIIGATYVWEDSAEIIDGWGTSKAVNFRKDIHIVVGGITYPISWYDLDMNWSDHRKLRQLNLVIVANLGDVEIPPSRESLEFTSKTKNHIKSRLVAIEEEFKQRAIAAFQACNSPVEAANSVKEFNHEDLNITKDMGTYTMSMLNNPLTDSDSPISDSLPVYTIRNNGSRQSTAISKDSYLKPLLQHGSVCINDLGSSAWSVLRECNDTLGLKYVTTTYSKKADKGSFVAQARYAAAVLGLNVSLLSSVLTMPDKSATAPRRVSIPDQIFIMNKNIGSTEWYPGDVVNDLPKEGYYVELTRSLPTTKDYKQLVKLMPTGSVFYGLRSKARDKAHLEPKLHSLRTLVPKYVAEMKAKHKRADKIGKRHMAFRESGLDTDFCHHDLPAFEHPTMRLVQQFGSVVRGEMHSKATPGQIGHHIREYEADWKTSYTYQVRQKHIDAFQWVSKNLSPITPPYGRSRKDFIVSLNNLITTLREPKV
jgi:hypothetical protein